MTITRTREYSDADRYLYDNLLCPKGFAQIDSQEDASYYGNWASPSALVLFSYAEGDCTTTTCDTPEEFAAEVRRVCDWLGTYSKFYGIDTGLKPDARKPWESLGLADLLHDR